MTKYQAEFLEKSNTSQYSIFDLVEPNSKVLEFGPAHGILTKPLKERKNCVIDIVEISEEYGKEAAEYARTALKGKKEGDIESYFWCDRFAGEKYDYIIFADVLEHLFDPKEVLKKSREFLEKSGEIIVSVPNVANDAIMINLYNNLFCYTEEGLLDNTHIKFFAMKNIPLMADELEMGISYFDALYLDDHSNEQSDFFDDTYESIKELLFEHKAGNAYQFIFKLCNDTKTDNSLVIDNFCKQIIKSTTTHITLQKKDGLLVPYEKIETPLDKDIKYKVDVDETIDSIIINPAEGLYYRTKITVNDIPPNDYKIKVYAGIKDQKNEAYYVLHSKAANYTITADFSKMTSVIFNIRINRVRERYLVDNFLTELGKVKKEKNSIVSSRSWKLTSPLRRLSRKLSKNSKKRYGEKDIKKLKNNGEIYQWHYERSRLSSKEYKRQRNDDSVKELLFSIIVPVYNTDESQLREMINSVIDQTYSGWELCMADASDDYHGYVSSLIKEFVKKDKRIRYKKIENKGISENSNAAIEMAKGNYFVLLDHDDLIHPSALYHNAAEIKNRGADFLYSDEDKISPDGQKHIDPYYKPDFSPDLLRANNYICHLTVFSRELYLSAGCFRKEFDGAQDHDLFLRMTEKAKNIVHIKRVLYHWRMSETSTAMGSEAKEYTTQAGINAVREQLDRLGTEGKVSQIRGIPNNYRVSYKIQNEPLISIIIPNCDHVRDLKKCLNSITKKSTYKKYEIIIIENNSKNKETFDYYEELEMQGNIKVVIYESNKGFNYSAINNYGRKFAEGEHLLFMNNDTEVITKNWMEEMLMFSQRKDVGAVGAKLYYPDDTIQHAGTVIGIGGIAGHIFFQLDRFKNGYFSRAMIQQNLSAVTAACMMVRKNVFDETGGFEEELEVQYNDVDFCLKIREAGYLICWTPFAELYHYESKSRGIDILPSDKQRAEKEAEYMKKKWHRYYEEGDPYYNPNLSLRSHLYDLNKDLKY